MFKGEREIQETCNSSIINNKNEYCIVEGEQGTAIVTR